jgi:hypothetical protein
MPLTLVEILYMTWQVRQVLKKNEFDRIPNPLKYLTEHG